MLVIKSKYNFLDISKVAQEAGINRESIFLRKAEGDNRLWRAWLSTEVGNVSKAEKSLLWELVRDGNEAVVLENNNRGWRRALK